MWISEHCFTLKVRAWERIFKSIAPFPKLDKKSAMYIIKKTAYFIIQIHALYFLRELVQLQTKMDLFRKYLRHQQPECHSSTTVFF